MLVKEIDFSKYSYSRICVIRSEGPAYFPSKAEAYVIKLYGNETVADENGIEPDSDKDWLNIRLADVKKGS